MYSDEDLDSAVAAGAITPEAVASLRAHVTGLKRTNLIDEEHFRLVSGFNDIFVVIAGALLMISVAWIGSTVAPWFGALASCGIAWALSEVFVKRRRMALPAIVFLLAFVGDALFASFVLLGKGGAMVSIASAVAVLAAWAHWKRFHVPITVAACVGVATYGVIVTLTSLVPSAKLWAPALIFLAGIGTFAYALYWDGSDARRQTRRSDVAFWLHLLAAPLIVHPVFMKFGILSGGATVTQALFVLALYICISLVSLAIDRRALMVSSLSYILYAFSSLLKQEGVVSLGFAITALVIGTLLLVLSAYWHSCREFALRGLPARFKSRLAPLS